VPPVDTVTVPPTPEIPPADALNVCAPTAIVPVFVTASEAVKSPPSVNVAPRLTETWRKFVAVLKVTFPAVMER
jgi:hypothetical protein